MKDTDKINCYCGQSGNIAMNMLYCVKCKRWLHEECVKCLDDPMLYGDRFYILICSVCNAGSECLARVELTWSDLVHLVLYHLSVSNKTKYFDLDKLILPFIAENWERLHLFGPITSVKSEDRRSKVLEVLNMDERFKSGREIKKSKNIFGLRQRTPPEPPTVQPSGAKLRNDVVVWEFQVKERRYQILTTTKSKSRETKEKIRGRPRKKVSPTFSSSKEKEVSKCHGGLPYNENGIIEKAKNSTKRSTLPLFTEEFAVKGLLDSLIPIPAVFTDENNPFCSSTKAKSTNKDKFPEIEVLKEIPSRATKRRRNGELISQNSIHKPLEKDQTDDDSSFIRNGDSDMFDAKDYLNGNIKMEKKEGLCIVGKRIAKTGKVQHLFQKNRRKVMPEAEPPFKMSFLCECYTCKFTGCLVSTSILPQQ